MAQQIFLGAGFGEPARRLGGGILRRAPIAPDRSQGGGGDRVLGERVEQLAVGRRIEQAALLALALDLDEVVA